MSQIGLSKSRLTAFEQCPKRLWLQVHRRDLAQYDSGAEARFAAGHEVGAVACALLPDGILIEAEPDLAAALATTSEIIASGQNSTLFEATFVYEGVLVRVDVLEPDGTGGWHVAEVKSSTSRKDYHLADLATQVWVMQKNGLEISSASIRHINNRFVLAEEGQFEGLLVDAHSLVDIGSLVANRGKIVDDARAAVAGPEPTREIGSHCSSPFTCEFQTYCNQNTVSPEWPVSLLPNTGKKVAAIWADRGVLELTDVPADSFSNLVHTRVHAATCSGKPFHDADGARLATAHWTFPRTYLDFETIAFAVPRWIGTKPYEQVPFQFSAHVETSDGLISHHEFLSIDGSDPRRRCAEAILQTVPEEGTVIAYSAGFERGCILRLAERGLRFVAMDHVGCGQRSDVEVQKVKELVMGLLGTKFMARDGSVGTIGWKNILIVAPYNMQVNALASALPGAARVGTVDKFQGQEAEVVIVSLTTSTPDDLPRHVEFFYSKNRINVAISRARTLAVVLANPKLLELDAKNVDHLRLVNTLAWVAEDHLPAISSAIL